MNDRIKVLFIHQDGLITGSAISLKYLLLGLDRNRLEIRIILAGDGPLKSDLQQSGYNVEVVPMRGFWTAPGPKWYRRGAVLNLMALFPSDQIIERVRAFAPDIIHINDKAMLVAGVKLRHMGIPIIQHLRSTYYATNTSLFAFISKQAIKSYASFLIGISEDELFEFRDFQDQAVVHNSLDFDEIDRHSFESAQLRKMLVSNEHAKVVTFIGLFSKTKGAWDFIDMVSTYSKAYPAEETKFMMVGKLPDASKRRKGWKRILDIGSENDADKVLQQKLQRNNLSDKIILTGYRKDILDVIAASDVLVMCNRLGAMGRQAFESMAVGTPLVITAGQSGKSSVAINGLTAKVVPAAEPARMAAAVREVLSDPAEAKKMVDQARRYVRDHFDYKKNAARVHEIYEKVLRKKQGI